MEKRTWWKEAPYRDYYIWRDGIDDLPPNNWGAVFGGSAWKKDELAGQYYLHLFAEKQPDLNWANEKVREEVFNIMRWWCEKGIDGFRMDAIAYIGKESFEDGVKDSGCLYASFADRTANRPLAHTYLREMREKVLNKYDIVSIGETGCVTPADAIQYASYDGSELNMVFQFDHVELNSDPFIGKWNDKKVTLPQLREVLNRWQMKLAGKAWNSLFLTNHDQPRCVSRFGNDSPMYRARSAKMLATMAFLMKGTPFIYQGDELGMTNIYFTALDDYRDIEIFNTYHQFVDSGLVAREDMMRYFALLGRDNGRTPMQWNTSANAGFTTGDPWIKVNRNYLEINAEDEMNDPDSVFSYYKRLIRLHHTEETLVYGDFVPMLEDSADIYAYERVLDDDTILILCNFTDRTVSCQVEYNAGTELLSNYNEHKKGYLYPYEAVVVRL